MPWHSEDVFVFGFEEGGGGGRAQVLSNSLHVAAIV